MTVRKAGPPVWDGLRSGATVLVDSAPLIYWLEGHRTFAERYAGLFEAHARGELAIGISTITLAEVLAGPFKRGALALAKRYERALTALDVHPVSPAVAVSGARLRARYGLKLPDALQLATALEVGADALVTHDRDFSRVDGIRVIV